MENISKLSSENHSNDLKPILKWAGGKNKIIVHFEKLYNSSGHKRYVDLFCGSLSLPLLLKPKNAIFNDINNCLINVYEIVRDNLDDLKKELSKLSIINFNNKEKFNTIRDEYNFLKFKKNKTNKEKIRLASIFIYLNKRSFNGLYRENQDGKYNVPYRQYKTEIYNSMELDNLSKYFQSNKIKFKSKSYNKFDINKFKKGDLVYIDPPYYPCDKSSFTSYWKKPFLVDEQIKLSKFCKELDNKKIKFIVSNSPCQEIKELYKDYNMKTFYIGRQMRSGEGKSDVFSKKNEDNEILIWNFDIDDEDLYIEV